MNTSNYDIRQGNELRIQCDKGEPVTIEAIQGSVEVNGCKLLHKQVFANLSLGIYAWDDSKVSIQGTIKKSYLATSSLVPYCVDVHQKLQAEREKVSPYTARKAPRVLILGPQLVDIFSIARTLVEYAVRCGESLLYLDFDVRKGNVTVPGCMSATVCTREAHLATNAQNYVLSPTVEFFGFQKCMDNYQLFRSCMNALLDRVEERMRVDEAVQHGGIIVNGGSWYSEDGSLPLLKELMDRLQFDLVLILQDSPIKAEIEERFPSLSVKMFPPVDHLWSKPEQDMLECNMAIDWYFYGVAEENFYLANPNQLTRPMDELTIVSFPDQREMEETNKIAPEARSTEAWLKPMPVPIEKLPNQILAVTDAKSVDEVRKASVLGFVFVAGVDLSRKMLKLVTPAGGDLPGTILVKGRIEWSNS